MKALTVCQPYAALIADGSKFVENRVWSPRKKPAEIAIHAGLSKKWLRTWNGTMPDRMTYGAIIAIANVDRIVHVGRMRSMRMEEGKTDAHIGRVLGIPEDEVKRILGHEHAEGPWGYVLSNVRVLKKPVPCKGARQLWDVPIKQRMEIRRIMEGR